MNKIANVSFGNYNYESFTKFIQNSLNSYSNQEKEYDIKNVSSEEIIITDGKDYEQIWNKVVFKIHSKVSNKTTLLYYYYTEISKNMACIVKIKDKGCNIEDYKIHNYLKKLSIQVNFLDMAFNHIQSMTIE